MQHISTRLLACSDRPILKRPPSDCWPFDYRRKPAQHWRVVAAKHYRAECRWRRNARSAQ